MTGVATEGEGRFSLARFFLRVMIAVAVPVAVAGAGLWHLVSQDQLDRTVDLRATEISRSSSSFLAPLVTVADRAVDVADQRMGAAVDAFALAQGASVEVRIIDPLGQIVWSRGGIGPQVGDVVAIDGSLRSALAGNPAGSLLTPVAGAQPVRYVVPVAVDGKTVAAADVVLGDDPLVTDAIQAATALAWLFGGAFLAMLIALVPLGWWAIGSVRRNMRRTRSLAMSDALTGLANRTQFHIRLEDAIAAAQRSRERVGLVLLDLDGFKAINDTGGHAAGDRLLRRVAAGLGELTRRNELACRLGGDEFAVVVPRISDKDELRALADRLHEKLDLPVAFADGRTLRVTASIGLALYPDDARNGDDLVNVADAAMYRVKVSRKASLPATLRAQAIR